MLQRNLCGRQHWSGHCLFRESQGVSQTFSMQASFLLSPPPSPFFRGPFFLFSAIPLSGPYWEDSDRHSAQPKVCLPVWPALVWDKSTLTLPTVPPTPLQKNKSTTDSHIFPNSLFRSYLPSAFVDESEKLISKSSVCFVQLLYCQPWSLQIRPYQHLGCISNTT